MNVELVFVLLFCAATAVAIAARPLRVPYTVALVVAGTALGMTHALHPPSLTKDLLFTIFLPALVFESAFHLDVQPFWRNKLLILALAVPGVVAGQLVIGFLLSLLPQFAALGFASALLFGAIVVATDPVAVLAIFREVSIPRRLAAVVEGESLLNDGTGVVVFTLMLSVVGGATPSAGQLVLAFLKSALGGAALGGVIGFVAWRITRRLDDPMIEITLTVIAAYGSFGIAEQLGLSGVIATATAGILCGSIAAREGMSERTRSAADVFWDYISFALNSVVFLLIGFQIDVRALLPDLLLIVLAWGAVTFSRAAVLYVATAVLRLTRGEAHWRWTLVSIWSGLRGALGMTLALSVPSSYAGRELIVRLTYGVVLLTLLVQGLTLRPMLRLLDVREEDA